MHINVDLDLKDVMHNCSNKELMEFIVEADLQVADASFTEELIDKLMESLSNDAPDLVEALCKKYLKDVNG